MTAIELTPHQKKAIEVHLDRFKSYLATEEYLADQRERERRVTFFHEELPARLPELSEADITELVTMLWATAMWGNKQYHAQQIITENGIDKLRQELTSFTLSQSGAPPSSSQPTPSPRCWPGAVGVPEQEIDERVTGLHGK